MERSMTGTSRSEPLARFAIALLVVLCAGFARADRANQQYQLAASHYTNGRWELAIAEFDAFLNEYSQHAWAGDAMFFAAEAEIQRGEYAEGAKRLKTFEAAHPSHRYAAQAMYRRGECDYFQGNRAEAQKVFLKFIKDYPRNELLEFALPYLGELAYAEQDWDASYRYYQRALEKFPTGRTAGQCRFGLAQALAKQGRALEAERFYRFVATDAKSPASGEAKLRLGGLLIASERHTEAETWLRQVIVDDSLSQWHGEANYLLLQSRYARREWSEVAAIYRRVYAEQDEAPHAADALMLSARAFVELGSKEMARQIYARVIKDHTDVAQRTDALVELTKLELADGDQRAAQNAIEKLTQHAEHDSRLPPLEKTWLSREIAAGRYDVAENWLATVKTDRLEPEASYFAGLIDLGREDYRAALIRFDRLNKETVPESIRAALTVGRGTALFQLGRYAEAISPLNAYLDKSPSGADAPICREYLAISLAEKGRWNEAVAVHRPLSQGDVERYLAVTMRLADTALANDQHRYARTLYREVVDSGSATKLQSERALAALAYMDRADTDGQSSEALRQLLANHADSKATLTALLDAARTEAAAGDNTTALAKYHLLIERFANSEEAAEALLAAALIYDRLGQPDEAKATWQLLLAHRYGTEYRDTARYNLAWALLALEEAEAAHEQFEMIYREHKGSRYWVDATLRLAANAHRNGNQRTAKHFIDQVLTRDLTSPVEAHAEYLRGTVAAEEEAWPEVASAMKRVLGIDQAEHLHRSASYWLGEAQFQLRHFKQAEERFTALEAEASTGQPWEAMIPLRRAQCLAHRKHWTEAGRIAASIAERFPHFSKQYEADYLLGRSLAARAEFDQARKAYQRAIDSPLAAGTETASMASWMIGETWFHQKQYSEALRAYYRTAQFSPSPTWQAAAMLQAGKCHEVLGEWGKAAQRYTELLAISPATRFHAEAQGRLATAQRRASMASESQTRTR